jgi:hypothetical protein
MVIHLALPKDSESYSDKEAKFRFEAALKGAMNSHKPLKEKPKVKKTNAIKKVAGMSFIQRELDGECAYQRPIRQ